MTIEEKNRKITEKLDELKLTFPPNYYWSHNYKVNNNPSNVSKEPNDHYTNEKNAIVHYDNGSCGCNSFNTAVQCHGFAMYMAYRVFGTNISIRSVYIGETNVL